MIRIKCKCGKLEQIFPKLNEGDIKDGDILFVRYNEKYDIEKVKESVPDLIILDVMMPGMDGFETCRRLRKDMDLDIPIIMLTVKAEPGDKAKCFQMGADVYITKPFDYDNLIHHVRTLLGARLLN